MKTLENHTLLYDQECPLCQIYTSGFIKTRMLDTNGRTPFSDFFAEEFDFIDMKRASNEIALVNKKEKTVIYGIDSLLRVIGVRFPIVEKIGNLKPIKFVLKQLYSFISYNRKVIIPSKEKSDKTLQCIPSFNTNYRLSYIVLAILMTAFVLFSFSNTITYLSESSIIRESSITIGQIIFQGLFIVKLNKKTVLNYIGNLMTVSLMGSLLLLPILLLQSITYVSDNILLLWFGITASLMFLEHYRRIKLLKLPYFLSFTWVLYRILILLIILI
ncbi:hypothetical protein [uncultured Psychroserpens sp.]|uniref:hypothetical protein n=1 Tax=uncultured Psychroserpens sp. TaxID=255436 RepID=UPI00260AD952|nr:hypothetical protein [uncultured Psychroserpens sp.]